MSEQKSDVPLFLSLNSHTQTKIQPAKTIVELLPNGRIFVDWSDLPKHSNIEQYAVHYKSLNSLETTTIYVSRKTRNVELERIEAGHLYDIHVCGVDGSDRVLNSSGHTQIQTKPSDQVPILRVTESTPDFLILEWEPSKKVKISDIQWYKVIINGDTVALLPPTETRYVVNDGQLGKRYFFRLEMHQKDQKIISSLPIIFYWPDVKLPKHHAVIFGKSMFVCWTTSKSVHDGNIESYTVHLYDSQGRLIREFGPNPSECRQVCIEDIENGVYSYVLEMKLANSNQSIFSKPKYVECGRESSMPVLKYEYVDRNNEDALINMIYNLVNILDAKRPKHLIEKCHNYLEEILFTLTTMTDSVHLNLSIESKKTGGAPKSYYLMIDGHEYPAPIPEFMSNFPLPLARREKPYKIAVSVAPGLYGTTSNHVLVDASRHFSLFCTHFDQRRSNQSCSYMETLQHEKKHSRQPIHQGSLKSPNTMTKVQVYDLNRNTVISFPPSNSSTRLTILLFYIDQCVPSELHLNYLVNYASQHFSQYNFITINCNQKGIDHAKALTQNFQNIECYNDFSSNDFEYEQGNDEGKIHQIFAIAGVPFYFILDFHGRIVWKGRLCVENQEKYNNALDHVMALFNQTACPKDCELCSYENIPDYRINEIMEAFARNFDVIKQKRSKDYDAKETVKPNRKRQTYSMRTTLKTG